jgi:hypothetical protein
VLAERRRRLQTRRPFSRARRDDEEEKGSELRRVVAISLIVIAYLFIPILLLIIVILAIECGGEAIIFATSGDPNHAESAALYLVIDLILSYVLWRLIRWARE